MASRVLTSFVAVLSLLVVLVVGIWMGSHPYYLPGPVADLVAGGKDRRVVNEGLDTIYDRYYRPVSRRALSNAALQGAVKQLDDRFSAYFSPRGYARFNEEMNNQFSGVGMVVRDAKDGLRIVMVYPKSPAKRANMQAGDVITRANGHKLAGLSEEAATAFIKGKEGTKVTLVLRRGDKTLVKRLTRATISVPVVASRIANAGGKRAAYIALSSFSPPTAHEEVANAIRKQRARGAKGIVFDLRGNGGGLVSEAQRIASMFLHGGTIVTTKGRAVETTTLSTTGRQIAGALPTVVLVDGGTASASEIVAGALQDRKRAKLVGVRTFGKGVFQEITPLSSGGAMKITVGQYFLPSGRNLGGPGVGRGSGLRPDVRAIDSPKTPRDDEALQKALDVLAPQL